MRACSERLRAASRSSFDSPGTTLKVLRSAFSARSSRAWAGGASP